ncbi:ATP-binding protein [Aquimarina spongiae]|uniref:Histidine kinase-, DNA gyrase B-, and HSP90-like ATPase n=1 Tax=Aquimarina spongiae TaxID=570521 RepID=A0A1M6CVE0_9FLAO|nr:ATP-binding protein [Aquimarina spongiae]SHI64811.1 Histidine kinase-, DNA gyrase B-, and HSP90-like ATPase [Aquimarina spongiae]
MKTTTKKITTNTRVIKDHLTKYRDTFQAFRELINNAIQADSQNIYINIEYVNQADIKSPIKSIEIIDDGYGVSFNEFDNKILEIGTTVKNKGQGIGRFSSLQIGELMHIETVGYDNRKKQFTRTQFSIDTTDFNNAQLENTGFKVDYEYLIGKKNTYYKVRIERLHHNKQEKVQKRNLIHENFLEQKVKQAVFEHYPFEIFHSLVTFRINGFELKRSDFVVGKPSKKMVEYIDKKGKSHELNFYFYNINSTLNKVKVFFQIDNAGLKSVAHEYTYSSDWYTPDLGTWFIYIESPLLDTDLFRNLDIESLGEAEVKNLKDTIKNTINDFYKAKNKRFEKFLHNLERDKYYPYQENEQPASKSQEILFKKVAYLLEDEHRLIQKDNKIRNFLYPLLDKAIGNGNIEYIFDKVLKLSDESLEKFHQLLEKTDLEDVVHFASVVAEKTEFLEFLQELTYGEISKHLKERSQLHKIIENQLWIFGENYNGTPKLWSDKKIGKILIELRNKYFNYSPTEEDKNLISLEDGGLNDITDLFFLNEKITDSGVREIMVVELKAPKCAISEKELNQINRYAFTIEENSALPAEKVKYKLVLISSKLTKFAKSQTKARRKTYPDNPFLFEKKTEKNIEVYVMEWAELIEQNNRKLGYLSNKLSVKDKTVKKKFETEYAELIDEKISAQLRLVK